MKKQFLGVVVTTTWLILIIHASSATISLDTRGTVGAHYTTFLQSLRNEAKDRVLSYFGIPMLPRATSPTTFILVELKSANITITLVLDRKNLYVHGYADKLQNGTDRVVFTTDAPHRDLTTVLSNIIIRQNLTFGGSYKELENKAGDRQRAKLGFKLLNVRLLKAHGLPVGRADEKTLAEFLIVAVQVVAEATRFTYIEKQVLSNFKTDYFTPNAKVLNLENEWGKISTGIRKASSNGTISPPLQLVNKNGKQVTVTRVSEIKPDMGILNYVA